MTNGQGAGNGAGALTYTGKLPTNYNVILNSSGNYGKIAFANPSGTTAFGIDNSSTVTQSTYTAVVSGIASGASYTTSSGTYGSYNWSLTQEGSSNIWDLVFANFMAGGSGSEVTDATVAEGNRPAYNAARVIDANPNLNALFSGQSGNQAISNAVTQTLPLLTGATTNVNVIAMHNINTIVQARTEGQYGLSSGNSYASENDRRLWLKPFGSWANQSDKDGVAGYSADTYGAVLGADTAVTDADRVGLAFSYSNSQVDGNSAIAPQSIGINSYEAIFYGSHNLDATTALSYQLDGGFHDNSGDRRIAFTNTTAESDYNSWSGHVGAGLGRTFAMQDEKTSITPSIRADYTYLRNDSYSETGAGLLNLNVDHQTYQELIPAVDVKLTHRVLSNITAAANLGGGYDVINDNASITSAFAGASGATFSTSGIRPSPWLGRAGLGLVAALGEGTEISARYDAEIRDGYDNQTASLKARWAF